MKGHPIDRMEVFKELARGTNSLINALKTRKKMKDQETISQQPHELNHAALELKVPVWQVLKAMDEIGTNVRSEVYDYIRKQKESPVEPENSFKYNFNGNKDFEHPLLPPMRNKSNVLDWAESKDLLKQENALKQFAKMISEAGELGDAIIKQQPDKIQDGIGDTLVTLIILSAQLGYDIEDCLHIAYDEIKGRTGKTVGGTFIKD